MKGYETAEACCLGYYGEGNKCEIVDKCSSNEPTKTTTATTVVITSSEAVTTAPPADGKPIKWWYNPNPSLPGGGECVQNSNYGDNWPRDFPGLLYDSKDGCCENHQDVSCLIVDPITTVSATIPVFTSEPTSSPTAKPSKWYFDDQSNDCTEGTGYPHWMSAGSNARTHLFASREDCCLINSCSAEEKEQKWWPTSDGAGGMTCVYSDDYPLEFLQHAADFLFDSEGDCCAIYCVSDPGTTSTVSATTTESEQTTKATVAAKSTKAPPQTTVLATTTQMEQPKSEAPQTTTVPATTEWQTTTEQTATKTEVTTTENAPFVKLIEGFDSFDDLDNSKPIPWIFGNPAEWIVDDTHTLAGTGALRNVLKEKGGDTSALTLKVHVTGYAMIRCYAFIDIAMPYDGFFMEVNGSIRYTAYAPENEWIQIATGLAPGDNTVSFKVSRPNFFPPGEREKGSGYVWLDICEYVPMG